MTESRLIEIERVRSEAARHLAEHEIACKRRYGEFPAQLTYPERFDGSAVPFVRRARLPSIRSGYSGRELHRALALNWNGRYRDATGQTSEERARERALARCREYSRGHGNCFLYDVDGTVVFKPTTSMCGAHGWE